MKSLPLILVLVITGTALSAAPQSSQQIQPITDPPLSLDDFFGKPWPAANDDLSFDDVKDVFAVSEVKKPVVTPQPSLPPQPPPQAPVTAQTVTPAAPQIPVTQPKPIPPRVKEPIAPPEQTGAWKELNGLFRISGVQRIGTQDGIVTLQAMEGLESYSFRLYQPRQLKFPRNDKQEISTITLKLVRITSTTVQLQITELNGTVYESDINPVWMFRLSNP